MLHRNTLSFTRITLCQLAMCVLCLIVEAYSFFTFSHRLDKENCHVLMASKGGTYQSLGPGIGGLIAMHLIEIGIFEFLKKKRC